MSSIKESLEPIYDSLQNDNEDIDTYIAALKKIMAAEDANSVEFDPTRLAQSNRQGRKLLQSYFKKHGVIVTFPAVT